MKRLTLDETWKKCLSMWRWIAKQVKNDPGLEVYDLKYEWLENHGYKDTKIEEGCFFCERVVTIMGNDGKIGIGCGGRCPGQEIDKDFNCQATGCHWAYNSIAFYKKLVSLNKKRLAKKK